MSSEHIISQFITIIFFIKVRFYFYEHILSQITISYIKLSHI